jgi:allantoinase
MLPALPQRETTWSRDRCQNAWMSQRATAGDYPRDMIGYGPNPPDPRWPGGANIAVQFVLNYEEGAENNVLDGDPASETFLSEIIGAQGFTDRHMSMESLYEYGSRAGLWRLLRVFERRALPLTVFGVAMTDMTIWWCPTRWTPTT